MNEKNIVLNNVEAAKEFVKAASECDFDIDVYFNRIALDAKSLLGILSLDLRSKLRVCYSGENAGSIQFWQNMRHNLSKRGCLKRNCCLGRQFFSVLCIFLLINKSFTVILDITLFYQYANVC